MKLFGSAKGGARVAKRSKKTKADKPKKPLKVLAIVLTVVLCLEGLYFLCIYSNIPFIKKYRTIYINTAMNTMRHQWLATYFIPAEVIDQVRYEYGLEIAKSVGTESQWGKNADDTTTEPEQPGTNHIDAEIVEPEARSRRAGTAGARRLLRGVLGAGPRQRRRLRRRASGGDRKRLGEVLRQ